MLELCAPDNKTDHILLYEYPTAFSLGLFVTCTQWPKT